MPSRFVWLAIAAITASTFWFPGSTYLQSDTQIYVPILEHLRDPSLLKNDLIAQYPHVRYTMYDDAALGLRKITGASFRHILQAQNIAFRLGGVSGMYMLASAAGLAPVAALFTTSVLALGATIVGPAVLTIEYEPVPRGFALMMGILMLGLTAQKRFRAAGLAGAIGFLYHAPTVAPIWACYFLLWLRVGGMGQALAPLLIAAAALFISARFEESSQPLFTHISEQMEMLQRTRASYNWISIWGSLWIPHHALLMGLAAAAYWRCRKALSAELRVFAICLPVYAAVSIPLTYVLQEVLRWSAIPQFQPMRALALSTFVASFLMLTAACRAQRWGESAAWLLVPYLIPTNASVWPLAEPKRLILAACLAAFAAAGLLLWRSYRTPGTVLLAAVALVAVVAIPGYGGIVNYPPLHSDDLDELATWARAQTPKDAVFLFPYAFKRLEPGVFRAEALRAVYIDWKTGGQVNYFPEMAFEWWRRWQDIMVKPYADRLQEYRDRGIQYVVTDPAHAIPGKAPLFSNAGYLVYSTSP